MCCIIKSRGLRPQNLRKYFQIDYSSPTTQHLVYVIEL